MKTYARSFEQCHAVFPHRMAPLLLEKVNRPVSLDGNPLSLFFTKPNQPVSVPNSRFLKSWNDTAEIAVINAFFFGQCFEAIQFDLHLTFLNLKINTKSSTCATEAYVLPLFCKLVQDEPLEAGTSKGSDSLTFNGQTKELGTMVTQATGASVFAREEELCADCDGEGITCQDEVGWGDILSVPYACGYCGGDGLTLLGRIANVKPEPWPPELDEVAA